jgi:hypothetical protein
MNTLKNVVSEFLAVEMGGQKLYERLSVVSPRVYEAILYTLGCAAHEKSIK